MSKCKNCGHEIQKIKEGWVHATKKDFNLCPEYLRNLYNPKCYCGCTKPELEKEAKKQAVKKQK